MKTHLHFSRWPIAALMLVLPIFMQCQPTHLQSAAPVIALISDFGNAGAYVPQMKGAILTIHPAARIIDLTHTLEAFNLAETSYLLQKSTSTLPASSVIVAVVDPGVGSDRRGIALRTSAGQTFVGPDNGIFSHVIRRDGLAAAVVLDRPKYYLRPEPSATFHGRDIFGPVAAHLASGVPLAELGTPVRDLQLIDLHVPATIGNKINGHVVHIDHYGNIITDIHRTHLPSKFDNKLIKILFRGRTLTLPVVTTYAAGPDKRLFALINSDNELEISIKQDSAAKSLKPKIGDPITLQLN